MIRRISKFNHPLNTTLRLYQTENSKFISFERYIRIDFSYKDRLLAYIQDRKNGYGFKKNDTYRFYILSESDYISLSHNPRPGKNNTGGWYYTLSEVLSGKQVVCTDSKY